MTTGGTPLASDRCRTFARSRIGGQVQCELPAGHASKHGYGSAVDPRLANSLAAPLPGNVMVAPVNGDYCGRCRRQINVMEPIYRGPGGELVICAACHDAMQPAALAVRGLTSTTDARTSVVMRCAAQLLLESSLPGALREHARVIANELHGRAFLLERARDDWGPGDGGPIADMLRAIGEVRS